MTPSALTFCQAAAAGEAPPPLLLPAQPRADACGPSRRERRAEAGQTPPDPAPAAPPGPPATSPRTAGPAHPALVEPAGYRLSGIRHLRLAPAPAVRLHPGATTRIRREGGDFHPGPSRSPRPATARAGQAVTFRYQGSGRCREAPS